GSRARGRVARSRSDTEHGGVSLMDRPTTWREHFEALDPRQLVEEIIATIKLGRAYSDPRLPIELREGEIRRAFVDTYVSALRGAELRGPAYVLSAAEREARSRIASAEKFGAATAVEQMRAAGYEPDDYGWSDDEIRALVLAQMREFWGDDGYEIW